MDIQLKQSQSQKISQQHLQTVKLLQIPETAIFMHIEDEVLKNPALEIVDDLDDAKESFVEPSSSSYETESWSKSQNFFEHKKNLSASNDWQYKYGNIPAQTSLQESLLSQLGFLDLNELHYEIGIQLIGSVGPNGYLERNLEAIASDFSIAQYKAVDVSDFEFVLKQIQGFDPPGIGARNLQECLTIQLNKIENITNAVKEIAAKILCSYFDLFYTKKYDKIGHNLGIANSDLFKKSINLILKLNPKPGLNSNNHIQTKTLHPDFIVSKVDDVLNVELNSNRQFDLRIKKDYQDIFRGYKNINKINATNTTKEAIDFIKNDIDTASWFINAIKQRRQTLIRTMKAIVQYQKDFFLTEDKNNLIPLKMRQIAETVKVDVSTISRVISRKSVQTNSGVYPLKFFFTEGINFQGTEVSNVKIKSAFKEIIDNENKIRPYADEDICKILKDKGYRVARRTVSKYRQQLNIPVAKLRGMVVSSDSYD